MEKNNKKLKFTADQTRAYTHDGKDLIVAASAGAGKTAVLIEYIFNKVGKERNGEKTSISDILAMTFTEAAASSMKKKLFERMNEELSEEEINDGYDGEWLKKEAELLPSADICTIDSFCTNILSQYCYVIGWDPERPKTILDANTVAELKREVAHDTVVEYCKRNELFYEMAAFYSNNGNHTGNIENLLISVSDEIDRYADEEKWYKTVADHYAAKTFDELSQENKDIFFMTVKENLELMKDTLEEYLKLISNDLHLGEQQGKIKKQAELLKVILGYAEDRNGNVFTKLLSFDKPLSEAALFPAIRGKDLSPEQQYMKDSNDSYKAVYKPYAKTVKESFDTIKEYELLYRDFPKQNEALRERVALFIEVLREYRKTVNERKAELGGIDFVDMERAAIDILRHKDIADRLRKRYKYILIDEYQDTNDIQETLVRLICRKDPGNVFRVGDIKQSIYGFRSAKPSLMKEILKNAEDDEKIVFHENFRSSDIIIRFNNIIYSILMNIRGFSDTFSDEIDKASTILENKKENKEKCEIHLLDLSVEGERRPVREDRIDEAYYIVDRIRKMREVSQKRKEETKDEWSGLDEKKQKEWLYDHGIYADWKDYVILVRNHDHKTVMENAFRALGVPMFYIINKGYYDDVAVQTVISWLKWLNRIDDEIAMFSVLTSPFYEFSNNDLSRLVIDRRKENDGSRRYEYILKKHADIRDDYLHLKDIYEKKGLIVLLREIFSLHDFYYTKTTLQQRDDLALLYEKCNDVYERYPSIEDMLEWLAVNERADDGAATSISESSDVVRVITIHNSKGLEYPVVFYVASTLKAKGSEKGPYRLDETLGLSLEVYKTPYYLNYRPLLWQLIEDKHYREDIEEEIRLMYVATTRAMSKLIVVAFESQDKLRLTAAGIGKIAGKKEAIGNILREAIEANRPEIDRYCEVYHLTMEHMPQRGFIAAMKDSETYTMPVYRARESGYEESSPSSLEERRAYPLSYEEKEDRALRGTLIHKAFELLDFNDPDIGKLDLPLSEEDKKAVMNFFGHDLVKEIKNMELHRELPYALMEDGQYMHGFMDLMAIDDRHIILIDYKSDKGKTRDEYLEAYSGQQNAYRKALKHFGLPIECYLYSLELDEFIRVPE